MELYATAFIEDDLETESGNITGGNWAPPYRLTDSNLFNDEAALSIDSEGNMIVVYNQYDMEYTNDDSQPVIISDMKLMATTFEPCGSVEVGDIGFSDTAPMPNSTITVSASVVNNGLTVAVVTV